MARRLQRRHLRGALGIKDYLDVKYTNMVLM